MNKWIAEFDLEDGDTMPEHMDLEYKGARIDFHCRPLEQEPTTKNDLGVDCITRQSVLDKIQRLINAEQNNIDENGDYMNYARERVNAYEAIQFFVENDCLCPSVTPQEPKTGHWIIKDGKEQGYDIGGIKTWYIQIMCDKCGFIKTAIEGHTGQYRYCPICGAKMVELQESEE